MHNNTKLKLYLSEGALIKVSVCDVSKIPPYAQVAAYRGGWCEVLLEVLSGQSIKYRVEWRLEQLKVHTSS